MAIVLAANPSGFVPLGQSAEAGVAVAAMRMDTYQLVLEREMEAYQAAEAEILAVPQALAEALHCQLDY